MRGISFVMVPLAVLLGVAVAVAAEPVAPRPIKLAVFPFELVRTELEIIESAIQAQARSFEPGIEGYVSYVCKSSGKRIRPALALLTGGATGPYVDAAVV